MLSPYWLWNNLIRTNVIVAVVAGGLGIMALQTICLKQIASIDNIHVMRLPPIQRAVVFGRWQAGVKVNGQWSFSIFNRLFHVLRIPGNE
jgi:hypothetical protein